MSDQKKENSSEEKKETTLAAEILSWVEVIVVAVVLALLIDGFIIINATVPSGSMEKTIMTGDRVLGTRFAYWFSAPKRGDIVVFRYPVDEAKGKKTKFIKRIIGLPGETVTISDGVVYIDGEPLEENYINGTWVTGNDGYKFSIPEDHYLPEIAVREGVASSEAEAESFSYVHRKKILGKAYFRYWPLTKMGSLYKNK